MLSTALDDVKPPGADELFPVYIWVIIRAQPEELCSNIDYIDYFRNPIRRNGQEE